MSSQIYVKKLELAAWLSETERIESLPDVDERLDEFFEMRHGFGEEPEQVMHESQALDAIVAYEEIRGAFDAETQSQAAVFLDAFPPRLWAYDAPRSIGISIPLVEDNLNCWFLPPDDIAQLKQHGDVISAYCEAEVFRIANPTPLRRLFSIRSLQKERERKFRYVWGYTSQWVKILGEAIESGVGLLVYEV